MPDDLKDSILSIFEASLDAQLRAVRRLRSGQPEPAPARRRQGLSQVDMAYDILRRLAPPCISPNCWLASTPPFTSPSTARASSLPSPKRSPGAIASSAPTRIRSVCVRRPQDPARRLARPRGRLERQFPSTAYLSPRRPPGPGFLGVPGPALLVAHHLDPRRPAP